MSFSKRPERNTPQCFTKPLDSLKNCNNRFFWVDERVFLTVVDWRSNAPKDGMPAEGTYSIEAARALDTHRTPIQKQSEMLLCLVGISRRYYLGDEVYPTFLHDDDRDMDLFNLIRAPNPTKVKTESRPRAPHEVPLLTLTALRVIEMNEPAATDSSGVPFTIERSPLDFAHEARPSDQGAAALEMPSSEDVPATAAPRVGRAEETTTMDPPAAPEGRSSHGGKSLAAIQLGLASTVVVPEDAPMGEVTPIHYPLPTLRHALLLTLPSGNGITAAFEIRAGGKAVDEVRGLGGLRDKRIEARELEIRNMEASLEAEANAKRAAEDKSAGLSQELERMRAQFSDLQVSNELLSQQDERVEQRCAEIDARLDALSIDFDEELYPHMLTAIAGRQWVIGRGLHLAVMKCGESLELRQAFADVVSAGIAK
nr:hypothetical protein [Tanacetum cinerariifolium]